MSIIGTTQLGKEEIEGRVVRRDYLLGGGSRKEVVNINNSLGFGYTSRPYRHINQKHGDGKSHRNKSVLNVCSRTYCVIRMTGGVRRISQDAVVNHYRRLRKSAGYDADVGSYSNQANIVTRVWFPPFLSCVDIAGCLRVIGNISEAAL
jgi:hypothetical protein